MSVLKNKHVIAALIITPVLTIIAFIGTDLMVSEKPHIAQQGQSYELIARSNCRYTSGVCTLKNGDLLLDLEFLEGDSVVRVQSSHPLQGVKIGFNGTEPVALSPNDNSEEWTLALAENYSLDSSFQLVAKAQEALYFAENTLQFKQRATLTGN